MIFEWDSELAVEIQRRAKASGGSVELTRDVNSAFDGVDVVYAKSWGGSKFYGAGEKDIENRARFRQDWIVDETKIARGNDPIFMHCLPVRRNVVVTDGVIDSPRSVVIDEAENRLHIQKAIMSEIIK